MPTHEELLALLEKKMGTEGGESAAQKLLWQLFLNDREWRLNNIYTILNKEGNLRQFKATSEQLEYRRNQHKSDMIAKSRQLGMSTEIVIETLDACLINDNYRAAIIDRSEPDAWDKLNIARRAWEQGPKHEDPKIAWLWEKIHRVNPMITDSNGELEWQNGSRYEAGVSFTGSTLQSLHLSELGPIAAQNPKKAEEIRRGSMNAVAPNGRKVIETTMEGGRFGVCYDYFELAASNGGRTDLEPGEWKLHFFSWVNHPHYRLPGKKPTTKEVIDYFADLKQRHGLEVDLERQAWYEMKRKELKDEIWQQYPTVLEECIRVTVAGQIYPELVNLRVQGRVKDFAPARGVPLLTCWDLGAGANLAGWLFQKEGKEFNWIDWTAGEGVGASGMAEIIRAWERIHGPILCHFLPHDGDTRDKGSGRTYRDQLIGNGINPRQIRVVPRIQNVWHGIEEVRKRILRFWFHSRCDEKVVADDGTKMPGGLGRLEAYRKTPNSSTGKFAAAPFPDFCSHISDALRVAAEADARGMIDSLDYSLGYQPQNTARRSGNFNPFENTGPKIMRGTTFDKPLSSRGLRTAP